MNQFSSVFGQILNLFPRAEFEQLVSEHQAERHGRGFRCWTQFVGMMFCQLARAQSLREISDGLRSFDGKLSHLGIETPARSTLSYANEHRPWQLYRSAFGRLLGRCQAIAPGHRFEFKNKLYSMDSSTIGLCASSFDWARYKRRKGGVKLHLVLDHDGDLPTFAVIREARGGDIQVAREIEFPVDAIVVFDKAYNDFKWFYSMTSKGVFFVTRMKDATRYTVRENRPVDRKEVLSDQIIDLIKEFNGVEPYPLRRVELENPKGGDPLVFLTNLLHLDAWTISEIYRDRWQIEKFFRAIKQNLKIKTFVGTSENALQIQIWTALISLLVLRYLMFLARRGWSMSNLVAMLRHQLFVYRSLTQWLDNPFPPPEQSPQLALPQFG